MSAHRSRAYSPPRYYTDQPRATTGALYTTSFDTGTRGGSSSQTRASVSTASSARPSVEYSAQPMRKSTFADGKTKTEYAIRPRHDSFNPMDTKRPLSISTRHNSPPRRGPVVMASPRELTPTVIRDDSSRFLQPASSHGHHHSSHPRHNSTSVADSGLRGSRERRDKSYHTKAPYVQKVYDGHTPPRAAEDEGWSYTNEQEQFDKGFFRRPPGQREMTSRRERSINPYEIDRPASKRDTLQPPPSSSKQLVKLDRDDSDRYARKSGHESDPDRALEAPRRRHSTRPTVLHQELPRDDGYSSARDDYESRGHSRQKHGSYDEDPRSIERQRERPQNNAGDRDYYRRNHAEPDREKPRRYDRTYDRNHDKDYNRDERPPEARRPPRSRESSPERSGLKDLATTALGGLAAAGVVKGLRDHRNNDTESPDEEQKARRRKKHRHRSRKDDQSEGSDQENAKYRNDRARQRPQDGSSSETSDGQQSRRQRPSRRHRDDETYANGKAVPPDETSGRPSSKARIREQEESSPDRRSRGQIPAHKEDQVSESLESRTISPGENEDERPRRVQLVEPVKEKETAKPRGILKPARQVPFPEDPNPIREGVAPLKDATKDGIPPNARWTKISRVLVNPEALEKAQERFEERDDYVIVLRVISREEIKKLADKTKEIRGL